MPIQINEVVVRTVVDTSGESNGQPDTGRAVPAITDESEIVDKLLEIIKEKKER